MDFKIPDRSNIDGAERDNDPDGLFALDREPASFTNSGCPKPEVVTPDLSPASDDEGEDEQLQLF